MSSRGHLDQRASDQQMEQQSSTQATTSATSTSSTADNRKRKGRESDPANRDNQHTGPSTSGDDHLNRKRPIITVTPTIPFSSNPQQPSRSYAQRVKENKNLRVLDHQPRLSYILRRDHNNPSVNERVVEVLEKTQSIATGVTRETAKVVSHAMDWVS